ncbi:uncharacterized protein DDB_G0290685 [Thrips palmi]|uniref:Uncharacterized protein DDB_G0290685 n=1 Tax=Thrips palmi TaxID=161013 RepID=A0A6P9A597_THRPL|nr:uncharacterized protein DDB_G0290685 [Thrips palmi]
MLHKTDVSNLITGLRPKLKQAVTYLAHHNSKEITKLEARKGKDAEKCKRKAERLRLETLFLRKIVLDEVSKYALKMDFSQRQKLLDDINLPLETKVLVKLSTSKDVVSYLENFRSTHPEWKEKLPGLIETLGIFTRNKKKVKKNIEKSERKMARKQLNAENNTSVLSNEHKDDEKLKVSTVKATKKVANNQATPTIKTSSKKAKSGKVAEDSEGSDGEDSEEIGSDGEDNEEIGSDGVDSGEIGSDGEDSEEISSDGEENEEIGSDGGDSEEISSDGEDSEEIGSDGEDSEEIGSDGEDSEGISSDGGDRKKIGRTINKDNTKPLKKKRETHAASGSMIAEVRRFADLQKEDNSERKLNAISSIPSSSGPIENVPVEEDSFFLTGGNSFLKTVSVKRADGEGLDRKSWSESSKNLSGNRRQRRAQFTGKDSDQIKPKSFKNKFDKTHERKRNTNASGEHFSNNIKNNVNDVSKFNRKNFSNKNTGNYEQSNEDETLHPSWAAKRRQKISLNSPQGKKIVFKDNQTTGLNVPSSKDETLHPSWAAKRSQKVSLDSFQGKKIKFDDD